MTSISSNLNVFYENGWFFLPNIPSPFRVFIHLPFRDASGESKGLKMVNAVSSMMAFTWR
jgi:hypothetical protein